MRQATISVFSTCIGLTLRRRPSELRPELTLLHRYPSQTNELRRRVTEMFICFHCLPFLSFRPLLSAIILSHWTSKYFSNRPGAVGTSSGSLIGVTRVVSFVSGSVHVALSSS